MNDIELERLLNEEIENLPQGISPQRDLWSGIAHSLETPTRDYLKPAMFAASIALMVALGLFVAPQTRTPAAVNPVMAELVTMLQSEHESSKQTLLVQYQDREPFYPDWESQMMQLEEAEQVIYQALQEDSSNLELLKILRQVQTRQLELINSVFAPHFLTI